MSIVLFLLVGACSALLYFVGLWWTVQRLAELHHPSVIYLGSLLLRLACLLGIVYWASRFGQPSALAAFFAGFLITRSYIVRRLAGPAALTSES